VREGTGPILSILETFFIRILSRSDTLDPERNSEHMKIQTVVYVALLGIIVALVGVFGMRGNRNKEIVTSAAGAFAHVSTSAKCIQSPDTSTSLDVAPETEAALNRLGFSARHLVPFKITVNSTQQQ
jgi:hypothetical protein